MSKTQSGFYPAYTYTYEKRFIPPVSWENGCQILEFEGVMKQAMVCVNGEFAGSHAYGYSQFFIDISPYLKFGEENTVRVIARNEELSSRWYSGSGIYRDVNLYLSGETRIVPQKLRITTEYIEENYACVSISADISSSLTKCKKMLFKLELIGADGKTASCCNNEITVGGKYDHAVVQTRMNVRHANLWSPDNPYLYSYCAELICDDVAVDAEEGKFGIRALRMDSIKGFRINGIETKMRGACIHHDNGIIGAAILPDAEYFRVKKLKEAGFNAIRSAHHPASRALLDACDEIGMLVMDEITDIWNTPKNCSDFSYDFQDKWKNVAALMVDKDYNHPCVVLYSIGNEIPEIGRTDGAATTREMACLLHSLDKTRYVTAGMNGLLAVGDKFLELQKTIRQHVMDKAAVQTSGGAEALNDVMGSMEDEMLREFSTCDMLSQKLEESTCPLDVAGYNYLTARHELEHVSHPDRVVVGSETYPTEIAALWEIVERNHSVIGDFTWTGYDYLGEAGIGIPYYGEASGQGRYPDRLAYCGDININGYRRPVSYLREIAYGMRKAPYIAVERPEHYGQKMDANRWKYADCVDSWTWNGFEGLPVRIRVLADADEVELFCNGKTLGKKQIGAIEGLTAIYDTVYSPGKLTACAYKNGKCTGQCVLETAKSPVKFNLSVSNDEIIADGEGCALITADLVDENGRMNMYESKKVVVRVEGQGTLAGFGSANPSDERSFQSNEAQTYDGRVMAVVRAGYMEGKISVTFMSDGIETSTCTISAVKSK